jgi:hypothetical protein
MESGAVVKLLIRELLEILHGLWRDFGPERESHFTIGSFDDGVFRCGFGGTHGRRSEPSGVRPRKNNSREKRLTDYSAVSILSNYE